MFSTEPCYLLAKGASDFHCCSQLEISPLSSHYWMQEEITLHLLCTPHWAGWGSPDWVKAPLHSSMSQWCPHSNKGILGPSLAMSSALQELRGVLHALWAPDNALGVGAPKHPHPLPKQQGIISLRLAKSPGTIILNSDNNPAISEPATQTTSRKAETGKSGNYHLKEKIGTEYFGKKNKIK